MRFSFDHNTITKFYLVIIAAIMIVFFGKTAFLVAAVSQFDAIFLSAYGILATSIILLTFSTTYLRYKDPYEETLGKEMLEQPRVSCMIAVYNEEDVIERCIVSIVNQTYENKEVIFVNDKSTDGTAKVLDEYAEKGDITVIHLEENQGKKRALAEAMLIADGSLFAFSDSDSVWAPEALERAVAIFAHNPDIGALSGHVRALNANKSLITKIQDSWYEGQFSIRKAFESVFGAVTCVSGPIAVFRREAIFNFIPAWTNDRFMGQEFLFATDRTLTGFVLGNTRLGPKIKAKFADSPFVTREDHAFKDWKVVYSKAVKAWTMVPESLRKVIKQQVRWKKSNIRFTFLTGRFYWRKPFLAALVFYLHIVFIFVGPLVVIRNLIILPSQGIFLAGLLYIGGIVFIGFMFGLAYKIENRDCHRWIYRPLMSLLSTLMLSWLVYYSALTIRNMTWRVKR